MKRKQFNDLVRLNQVDLKKFLNEKLSQKYDEVYNEDGFLYAQGSTPVLLVAHMDTVHKQTPSEIKCDNGKISSPQGIGGDDRCGVFMILEMIEKYDCSVLFTEDEEVGAIGAEKFVRTKLAQCLVSSFNFIIEFDRKGNNDAVFYGCNNPEFEEFVTQKFFKTNIGSFSDISIIAPELKVSAVNLSCGYYNAHTKEEYVVWDEMMKVIDETSWLLDNMEDVKYEYIEDEYFANDWYGGTINGYGYGYGDESVWYIEFEHNGRVDVAEVFACSKPEAVGMFLMEYSNLSYENIMFVEQF